MKFAVERSQFASALAACCRVVVRKSGMAILSHVLVKAEAGFVTIRGTDLDMDVSFRIPADIETDGSATILAEMLDGFIQRVKSDVVTLTMNDAVSAELKAGKSRLTIPTLDAKDFPSFQDRVADIEFTMPGDDLSSAINQCAFAVTDDLNSHYLPGIYVHLSLPDEAHTLRFAANVGPCFFLVERSLPAGAERLVDGLIIPKAACIEVARLAIGDVSIAVSHGYTKFSFSSGATLATKLIEGRFPDYRRAFPSEWPAPTSIGRKDLADALDRVALTSDGKDRCVRIEFADGSVLLDKKDANRGHVSEELQAETGAAVAFGMNSIYLSKSIKTLTSDRVEFFCADANRPIMLRPAGLDSPTCMMAPIRIAG